MTGSLRISKPPLILKASSGAAMGRTRSFATQGDISSAVIVGPMVEFVSLSAADFDRFGEPVRNGVRNEGSQVISPQRRAELIDALRRGTVPKAGLDALAVGYGRLQGTLDEELDAVASGRGAFKAIRGEYGSGKTFFGRWLQERARARGLVTSEVQISETETPLHRLETVYRRLVERIATADSGEGAFRGIIDGWFYALERDVLEDSSLDPTDEATLLGRTDALMEARLVSVTRVAPAFSATLRAYRRAL